MTKINFFSPHDFKTGVTFLNSVAVPEIIISNRAYMDIAYIISQSPEDEISWLGSVDVIDGNYIISDVYLLEQTVSGASISITEASYAKLIMEVIKTKGIKEANKLRFWGHLHPGNSTSPSHVDNEQMKIFEKNCKDFFIRGIFGRKGRAEFSVFDYTKALCFSDTSWSITIGIDVNRKEEIKKLIDTKIKKEIILPFVGNTFEYNKHVKNYPYGLDDEFFKFHNIDS